MKPFIYETKLIRMGTWDKEIRKGIFLMLGNTKEKLLNDF